MIERDRRRGIAGNDRKPRMKSLDEPTEQRRDSACELCVAFLAVGEACAVCGVDDRRGRQERARGSEHRQASDAGIEEKDGSVRIHGGCVACRSKCRKLRRRDPLLLTLQ